MEYGIVWYVAVIVALCLAIWAAIGVGENTKTLRYMLYMIEDLQEKCRRKDKFNG